MKILVDSREQKPLWTPGDYTEFGHTFSVEKASMRTGDYTVAGLEALVLIERKSGVDELAAAVGYGRARFERELRRMVAETQHRVLIIEGSADSVRMPRRSRVSAESILGSLAAWGWRFGLHTYWAGTRALAKEITLRTLATVSRDPERLRRQVGITTS